MESVPEEESSLLSSYLVFFVKSGTQPLKARDFPGENAQLDHWRRLG